MSRKFIEMSDRQNMLIVDGLNLAYRYLPKAGEFTPFSEKYVATVASLAQSYKAKKIFVLGDYGSSWRKSIYPEYKQNRRDARAKQSDQEKLAMIEFIAEFDRACLLINKSLGLFLKYPGVEADDIASLLVNEYADEFEHTWLISSDKDWDLLVRDNVSRFSNITRKEYNVANWDELHEYPIEQAVSIKCLMGDKSDNIKGIPQIGIKRAITILREYGSALNLYDSMPIPGTLKYIQNINNSGNLILDNYTIIDLNSFYKDALGDHIDDIRSSVEEWI